MQSNQTKIGTRLKLIQYWLNWVASGFTSGKWNSIFLGRGFEFQGVAPFIDDPDLIRINWQATLTADEITVSQFSEEKNIDLYFLADLSASLAFGSAISKQDRLAILAASIAYSAQKLKDNFRFIGFTDKPQKFLQTHDQNYPQMLAKAILEFIPSSSGGGFPLAALSVPQRKSLVILISDFLGDLTEIERGLTILNSKHEVIPLIIWDEREVTLPEKGWGLFPFRDLENNELSYVFLNNNNRKRFAENSLAKETVIRKLFARLGITPYFLKEGNPEKDLTTLMKIFASKRQQF